MNTKISPQKFLDANPKYVYRDHKGRETTQWRQAALELAEKNVQLLKALREIVETCGPSQGLDDSPGTVNTVSRTARAILAKLGE